METVALVIGIIHIASAIALLNGVTTTFGQSRVACQAMESIARQPEAADDIRSAMFVGLAMCETSGIYGLLVSIIMLFANPLVDILMSLLG
jgi:F-type H+-transporting ATPase subunit c